MQYVDNAVCWEICCHRYKFCAAQPVLCFVFQRLHGVGNASMILVQLGGGGSCGAAAAAVVWESVYVCASCCCNITVGAASSASNNVIRALQPGCTTASLLLPADASGQCQWPAAAGPG
jgi:hypothetical protein